ncbi:hypothetical protein D9615_008640 [Tricholomella constricta]|uniref:N-acetyltransferase domain-containing protein n=1 Tax=Tricholomella constricta TaxID=117010 RepID=A0A8H5H4B3_9AGAR|nr:hypothetical protein D9615_008640 [Tricholomella constricta]
MKPTMLLTRPQSLFSAVEVGTGISDEVLHSCAILFSSNCGIWGEKANSISPYTKPDGELVGHTFATVWSYEGGVVGWIAQLVVDKRVRRRYVATQLLQMFKRHSLFVDVTAVGLVSSHPVACQALAKYACVNVAKVDLDFIRLEAKNILKDATVEYLKSAVLKGSIFEEGPEPGVVSTVFTQFYVDHAEPIAALEGFRKNHGWCLDDLPDGYEFLAVVRLPNPARYNFSPALCAFFLDASCELALRQKNHNVSPLIMVLSRNYGP